MIFQNYGLLGWLDTKMFFLYASLQLVESNTKGSDDNNYDIVEDENTGLFYYTKL